MMTTRSLPGSSLSRYPLLFVIIAASGTGLAFGVTYPLIALAMEHRDYSPLVNGANAAMPALAMVLVGSLIPTLVGRIGAPKAIAGSFLASGLAIALFYFFDSVVAWFGLRLIFGGAIAIGWVTTEICVNLLATDVTRGRLVAVYSAVSNAAVAVGPQILRLTGDTGALPFLTIGGLLLVFGLLIAGAGCLVPTLSLEAPAALPTEASLAWGGFWSVALLVPLPLLAVAASGVADTARLSFFPLWGVAAGLREAEAIDLLSVSAIGALLIQLPLGWLADRFRCESLLAGLALTAITATLALPFLVRVHTITLWVAVLVIGGALIGLYTVALTMLGRRLSGENLSKGNTILVGTYTVGSIIGPLAAGFSQEMSDDGLPLMMALTLMLFAIAGLLASRFHTRV